MDITLKNVKIYTGMSQETVAFNASVYIDGKKVGDARNSGNGGANHIDVRNGEGRSDWDLLQRMEVEAVTHTYAYENENHAHSLDSYIGELVDDAQEKRDLKRKCVKQTLFRVPNEDYGEGEYHVMNRKYDEIVKAYLIKSYGDEVVIANETVKEKK